MQRVAEARESRMAREIRRLAERTRRSEEHHRAIARYYADCHHLQQSHSAAHSQWMYEMGVAVAEGRLPPPPPPPFQLPDRPLSLVFSDPNDEQRMGTSRMGTTWSTLVV